MLKNDEEQKSLNDDYPSCVRINISLFASERQHEVEMLLVATIRGLILGSLENLDCFQQNRSQSLCRELETYVLGSIDRQQSFFRYPLKLLITIVALLSYTLGFCRLDRWPAPKRKAFLGVLSRLPIFSLLLRFIKSVSLLRLLELADFTTEGSL